MSDIIQTLWIGPRLSKIEQLSLASFVHHGHEVHLYTYDPVDEIPKGIIVKDANDILPKKYIFRTKGGSLACFSDWFRWKMLFEKGGYWVDTDVVCLKKFDFQDELLFGKESYDIASIGVLKLKAGNSIAKIMCDRCEDPNKIYSFDPTRIKLRKWARKYLMGNKRERMKFGEAGGPRGFSSVLRHNELFHLGKPFTFFTL